MASNTMNSSNRDGNKSHQQAALVQKVNKGREDLLAQYARFKQLAGTARNDDQAGNNNNNINDYRLRKEQINTVITQCQKTLDELFRIRMTYALLEETLIGKTMDKLTKKLPPFTNFSLSTDHDDDNDDIANRYEQLKTDTHTLLLRWKVVPGCDGVAQQALLEFRRLEQEYTQAGRAKPDMIAYKELRQTVRYRRLTRKHHGELEGVPIGLSLRGRGEAAMLGIHRSILSGIDFEKDQPCFAVCMAGKYDDDDNDFSHREDGIIVYTGMGGLNKRGNRQVEDQTETPANASLILSYQTGDPIRMLRKLDHKGREYQYDGLYQCMDYRYEASSDGPLVYKFLLQPVPNQSTFQIRKKARMLRDR